MDSAAPLSDRRVGTTLKGKYRLEQLLGIGGMAIVYRGSHRNGNRVAVKVLHGALSGNVELRDRFLREGYVANRVDHRGAVRVLDDDVAEDGSVFLVMELLEGETLSARWERGGRRLPHREVAVLASHLLDVLAAAHEKGIVHRDIKPENLFLTRDGTLKVLDFGIARLRDSVGVHAVSATRTGHILGTPAYMPPEQVLGRSRDIDGQTDLWAVGATMFALVSGCYVHEAETISEMVVYAGSRHARPLCAVTHDVPPALAAVVDRALAFDKANRWPSAREMQVALEAACGSCFGLAPAASRLTLTASSPALFAGAAKSTMPTAMAPPVRVTTLPISEPRTTAPTASSMPRAPASSTTGGIESRRGNVLTLLRSRFSLRTAAISCSVALLLGGVGTAVAVRRGIPVATVPSSHPSASPPGISAISPDIATSTTPSEPTRLVALPPDSMMDSERLAEAGTTQVDHVPHVLESMTISVPNTRNPHSDGLFATTFRAPAPPAGPNPRQTAAPAGRAAPPSYTEAQEDTHALERVLSGLRAPPIVQQPSTPASMSKPDCQPPYTIDNTGRRIPKPECL